MKMALSYAGRNISMVPYPLIMKKYGNKQVHLQNLMSKFVTSDEQ